MGAGRGIPPRYALQGTRNTREVGERHTLWTFVTREAGRYTRALGREVRLFLALVTFSLRALIFTAAEALSLSLSLSLSRSLALFLGAPNAVPNIRFKQGKYLLAVQSSAFPHSRISRDSANGVPAPFTSATLVYTR